MYDSSLRRIVKSAASRLQSEMREASPFMETQVTPWRQQLSGSTEPEDYFLHPKSFPMLLLPWCVGTACRKEPDVPFQSALAYSTINGYYYIRLIDNVMDGDKDIEVGLLPSLNFFHTQFQSAYQDYFPAGHPFWAHFTRVWLRSGESAMEDASLGELDRELFVKIAAQKVCAVKIPVVAVCYHCERPELIEPWYTFIDRLGCWHQMFNDVFDWFKDTSHAARTYFLSEAARRKGPDESVAAWVVREGFAWGCEVLAEWMTDLKEQGNELGSRELRAYLDERAAMFAEQCDEAHAGLQGMARLLAKLS